MSISPHSGGTVPDLHRVPFPLAGLRPEPIIGRVPWTALIQRWLPVVVWAAVIFPLSAVPSLNSGLGGWDLALRKLAHLSEYAVLGALLARAVPEQPALWLGIVYAGSDELHQHFVPGREAALLDVGVDAVGVLIGILLLRRLRQVRLEWS